ncbi:hypothetical protein SOVF_130240 [Spinacia oleracea]|nr:hypothetical protein SOVF_130240 [Spinacia oleracea]
MAAITGGGSNGGELLSRWPNLPGDVLASITDLLDPKIGILRLRSICRSWRSSLSLLPPAINFPLKLPLLASNGASSSPSSHPPSGNLFLHERTVYFLSPPGYPSSNGGFLIKVKESKNAPNTFSLLNPILFEDKLPQPNFPLNLLDCSISLVCKSYVVSTDFECEQVVLKKVAVSTNFVNNGEFVVLGLKFSGGLLIWRFGDEGWTEIGVNGRCFDDIISYNDKFYATADMKGRLVMIDSRLKPIDLVPKLMFGSGISTHLVECDGNLYVVDQDIDNRGSKLGVFKLDDKGHFWDYELDLNDSVFFVGDYANFSLSRKYYNGGLRNMIYFKDVSLDDDGGEIDGHIKVFDLKTNTSSLLFESEKYAKLCWPPLSWFSQDAAIYFN